ncbi:MAG: hypothetical protein R3E86_04650 [Pseudomonadales bacterium]
MRHPTLPVLVILLASLTPQTLSARVYAYVNEDGDYVISQKRPKIPVEYAILTDDGEFIRLVPAPQPPVPVTHWKPWFMPRQPDPLDAKPQIWDDAEPQVEIEEVAPEAQEPDED